MSSTSNGITFLTFLLLEKGFAIMNTIFSFDTCDFYSISAVFTCAFALPFFDSLILNSRLHLFCSYFCYRIPFVFFQLRQTTFGALLDSFIQRLYPYFRCEGLGLDNMKRNQRFSVCIFALVLTFLMTSLFQSSASSQLLLLLG